MKNNIKGLFRMKKMCFLIFILLSLIVFNSIFSLSLDKETVVIGGGDSESFIDYFGDEELIFRGQNNTLPTVTLIAPEDENVTTNRTPEFSWEGYDEEGDSLTYELNVSLVIAGTCTDPARSTPYSRPTENYTLPTYLKCLYDNGDYYEWSVRAHDGVNYGAWSEIRKIYIMADIVISLPVDKVEFGEFATGTNDTADEVPAPFILQNDGNCYINISTNATDLWTVPNPSDYFKYKIDNVSGEEGAFNWGQSQISWAQMPLTAETSIVELNWSDEIDSVEIDLNVTVPSQEVAGYKESIVYFTASLGES